jgi:biopolymer transport protein ExbD
MSTRARRKRKRKESPMLELNMTAMCDVVFQLLIYLILTAHPMDVIAHLDVNRPSPDARQEGAPPPVKMIQIAILSYGFTVNDTDVSLGGLQSTLAKLASISKTQTILIKCAPDSPHEKLIQVLDLCSQVGLGNLSVMSL